MTANRVLKRQLANVLAVFSLASSANFGVAFFSNVYERFGWGTSLNVALDCLCFSFVIAVVALIFNKRSAAAWTALVISLLTFMVFIAFFESFRFEM